MKSYMQIIDIDAKYFLLITVCKTFYVVDMLFVSYLYLMLKFKHTFI